MENNEQQTAAPASNNSKPAEQPQLTITDLQNLRSIIDLATRRGAFGAAEMTGIGSAFDRLNTFLNSTAPADQTTPPAQP